MAKITKQEFESYSEDFLSIFSRMMDTSEFENESKEEQEKAKKLFGLLLSQIEIGNIFTLYVSCEMAEEFLNEDFSAIKRRAKEHIIARGYYNPASPLTLAEYRERKKKRGWEKWNELWKNKEQSYQLLAEMSEEDQNFVRDSFGFFDKVEKIFPKNKDEELTEQRWQEIGFIWEDLLKVFEEAQKKLEQYNQNNNGRERERERDEIPNVLLFLIPLGRIMT